MGLRKKCCRFGSAALWLHHAWVFGEGFGDVISLRASALMLVWRIACVKSSLVPTHPCFFEHVPVLSQALWLLHVACSWPIESKLSQNQAFWPKNQSFCQITNHQAYWLTCHGKQHVMASNICIHMPCYIYLCGFLPFSPFWLKFHVFCMLEQLAQI